MIVRSNVDSYINVDALATYLGLSDAAISLHRCEIEGAIERATISVENDNNISLRDMTISLDIEHADGYCALYHHPIAEITEVMGGGEVVNAEFDGYGVTFDKYYRFARVKYLTKASDDAELYNITVLALAAKIFNDTE